MTVRPRAEARGLRNPGDRRSGRDVYGREPGAAQGSDGRPVLARRVAVHAEAFAAGSGSVRRSLRVTGRRSDGPVGRTRRLTPPRATDTVHRRPDGRGLQVERGMGRSGHVDSSFGVHGRHLFAAGGMCSWAPGVCQPRERRRRSRRPGDVPKRPAARVVVGDPSRADECETNSSETSRASRIAGKSWATRTSKRECGQPEARLHSLERPLIPVPRFALFHVVAASHHT
jgi:hypothetical protein